MKIPSQKPTANENIAQENKDENRYKAVKDEIILKNDELLETLKRGNNP